MYIYTLYMYIISGVCVCQTDCHNTHQIIHEKHLRYVRLSGQKCTGHRSVSASRNLVLFWAPRGRRALGGIPSPVMVALNQGLPLYRRSQDAAAHEP